LHSPKTTASLIAPPASHKHLYKLHGLLLPKAQHKDIRRFKRCYDAPSLHGNKVWRSSAVLMDYLLQHPIKKGANVVEVGCGWGGLSCFMAQHFNARVTAVDADAALAPYIDLVKSLNATKRVNFEAKRFETITKKQLQGVHTLIGSEICFWDEMTQPLFNLIRRARTAGVKQVLLVDPGRPPFLNLIDKCDAAFGCELVAHRIEYPWRTEKFILRVGF
jgi:predicted nicotinamide N-methyase